MLTECDEMVWDEHMDDKAYRYVRCRQCRSV